MTRSIFRTIAFEAVPRAMALIDLDPQSRTYGCADREFWCYRTIKDHPSAAYQAIGLGLAHVYHLDDENNPWCRDERIKAAVTAVASYWSRITHNNGAVDEWYRNEQSYCSTAFTVAAVGQSLLLLGGAITSDERAPIDGALVRAASWLDGHFNVEVMNQNLASALGLWSVFLLTNDARWETAAVNKWRAVADRQNDEGWLPEYGGADIGYATLALSLLAAADDLGATEHVQDISRRLGDFIAKASAPDGSFPGRLSSRGTTHVFPDGALFYANMSPRIAALASGWATGFHNGAIIGPGSVDDRYFSYFYFPQFSAAAQRSLTAPAEHESGDPIIQFPACGLWRSSTEGMDIFASIDLGAAVAIKRSADDGYTYAMGYDIVEMTGVRYSSAVREPGTNRSSSNDSSPNQVSCRVGFGKRSGDPPLVRLAIPFIIATRIVGMFGLSEWFQGLIKRRFVHATAGTNYSLKRTLTLDDGALRICDVIEAKKTQIATVVPTRHISMHSPSARQDISASENIPRAWDAAKATDILRSSGRLDVGWTYHINDDGQLEEHVEIVD